MNKALKLNQCMTKRSITYWKYNKKAESLTSMELVC